MPKRFNIITRPGTAFTEGENGISAARVMQVLDNLPVMEKMLIERADDGEPAPRSERQLRTRNTPV